MAETSPNLPLARRSQFTLRTLLLAMIVGCSEAPPAVETRQRKEPVINQSQTTADASMPKAKAKAVIEPDTDDDDAETQPADVVQLNGTWALHPPQYEGRLGRQRLVYKVLFGPKLATDQDGHVLFRYEVDATKTPHHIDLAFNEGIHVAHGIFSLTDGTLTICMARIGRPRPTSFTRGNNDEFRVSVLLRR